MTTKPSTAYRPSGISGRGADRFTCIGGCGLLVPSPFGVLATCGTCTYARKTLAAEKCLHLSELARRDCDALPRTMSRDAVLGRVSDVLRRTGILDAEELIVALERL
jgi:hypothetical protein